MRTVGASVRAARAITVVGCHAGGEIGNVVVHANLIVPPSDADSDAGFIIMEPTEYPAMSGSNTICVATVLLETGMVEMHEPGPTFRSGAPAGAVEVTARCH